VSEPDIERRTAVPLFALICASAILVDRWVTWVILDPWGTRADLLSVCVLRDGVGGMLVTSIIVAALLGALIGSVLTVLAWRVPRGLPVRAGLSAEGAEQSALWRDAPLLHIGAHDENRRWHGVVAVRPPVLELITGALFAVMVLRFGLSCTLPAYLTLAAASVLLSVVDLQHQRLPDVIVGPFAVAASALLAVAAFGEGTWEPLVRALAGGAILFAFYLILALITPGGLGMGDVKLAGVLGMYLAYLSWRTLILGAAGGFVIAAVVGVALLAARRASHQTLVPFGPAMLLAAMIAVIVIGP